MNTTAGKNQPANRRLYQYTASPPSKDDDDEDDDDEDDDDEDDDAMCTKTTAVSCMAHERNVSLMWAALARTSRLTHLCLLLKSVCFRFLSVTPTAAVVGVVVSVPDKSLLSVNPLCFISDLCLVCVVPISTYPKAAGRVIDIPPKDIGAVVVFEDEDEDEAGDGDDEDDDDDDDAADIVDDDDDDKCVMWLML